MRDSLEGQDELIHRSDEVIHRERNYSFEALAEVTNTDWNAGRGELNAALKSIKDQCEIEDDYLLADEIHARGKAYRKVMGEAILTPSALAKHWARVFEELETKRFIESANQVAAPVRCETCDGDRFVVYATRKPTQTQWMKEHGIEANESEMIEEMAACPECNPTDVSFHRHDGSRFMPPDPAKVRERLTR